MDAVAADRGHSGWHGGDGHSTPRCNYHAGRPDCFFNLRRHRAELIAYVLGCALVPAGLFAYLAGHHALAAAFDDVIRFTAQRYAPIQSVPFGFGGQNPPLKYLFPLAALLTVPRLHPRLGALVFATACFFPAPRSLSRAS